MISLITWLNAVFPAVTKYTMWNPSNISLLDGLKIKSQIPNYICGNIPDWCSSPYCFPLICTFNGYQLILSVTTLHYILNVVLPSVGCNSTFHVEDWNPKTISFVIWVKINLQKHRYTLTSVYMES